MTGPQRTFQVVGWVGDVAITMRRYSDPPAHFHASSEGREAAISIEHLSVLEGELPERTLDDVRQWAGSHREELRVNWRKAEKGEPLDRILDPVVETN